MGEYFKKMKLAIALLLLSFVAYTYQGNCLKASMCQTCDTTNTKCSGCSGLSTFKGGARYLNSGVCSVAGTAQKPTVGASHLAIMIGATRATASYSSSNMFGCKSGYYAYIDEVTTTLTGCYASSGVSSAPLSNITGTPVTACLTATTALANCYRADTAGTACAVCANDSYFGGSTVCVKSAFMKVASLLALAMLALIQ